MTGWMLPRTGTETSANSSLTLNWPDRFAPLVDATVVGDPEKASYSDSAFSLRYSVPSTTLMGPPGSSNSSPVSPSTNPCDTIWVSFALSSVGIQIHARAASLTALLVVKGLNGEHPLFGPAAKVTGP